MTGDGSLGERPAALALACALAGLAGAVDVCGLIWTKDLYVSFMSGNTISLGVAASTGDWREAVLCAELIALFVAGSAAGEALAVASERGRAPAVTGAVALCLTLAFARPDWTVVALVVAMGALNAAMPRAGGVGVSLTFVTGTLMRLGQGLGRALCGRRDGWGWLRQAIPWVGLLAGASAATYLQSRGVDPLRLLPFYAAALALAGWWLGP